MDGEVHGHPTAGLIVCQPRLLTAMLPQNDQRQVDQTDLNSILSGTN